MLRCRAKWVENFKKILAGPLPQIEVGDQCENPYECPFCYHCWPEGPDYPISILPRARKHFLNELLEEGYEDVRDIPDGRLGNENHERVRRVTISGRPETDPGLKKIFQDLEYPRFYLDFESLGAAVPIWKGTRPYQTFLPFQWSCHIEEAPGKLRHEGYLDVNEKEPMRPLSEKLLKTLGRKGPILTWGSFENSVIATLARFFVDLSKDLKKIQERILDLLPIMRANYYHPEMYGSWSIKAVLPTITTELNYGDIEEVQDGMAAQAAYIEAIDSNADKKRCSFLKSNLWEYCKLDTLAMVKIVHYFYVN